ncbi:hypothetical protein AVEN_46350-1 [Araneus ventricosus]|uniref:Uncharacterized protein n=1 Tax=Araneus ventricosus TaxID=182803 RepID=A0A4Y2WKD8_ARAVE|nr:hypothetical protein AVEN_46350-1 [Araneus ventricosus]
MDLDLPTQKVEQENTEEFQLVSPRKAAKIQRREEAAPPIETENRFQNLTDDKSYPATISLKPQGNYKQIIKEIAEKFPGTENRWIYDFINIKPPLEECRIKILALLNEKKADYLLNEQTGRSYAEAAAEKADQPIKTKTEEKTDDPFDLEDIKESMKAIKEVKTLLDEFPTLLEVARLCKVAKTRTEKVLIVLNALVGV